MSEREAELGEAEDFWHRFNWWVSAVWLFFLIFPVLALVQEDRPLAIRVIGLGLLAVYAIAYLRGYLRFSWTVGLGGSTAVEAWAYFLVMALVVVACTPILGVDVLGLLPFLSSYAAFLLTRRATWITYGAVVLLALALPLYHGQFMQAIFLIGLNLVLMVVYLVTVAAIERSVAADQLKADYLVVSEQECMARDVHDGVGHSLTALNLKAQLALRLLDAGQVDKARAEVEQLSGLALQALDSVRATVQGLSRGDLDGELRELRRACADSGMEFHVVGQPGLIPQQLRSHVSWVVREALTNVLRHAHASGVWVNLSGTGFSVDDDGDGMEAAREGHGIRGMRERARLIGAGFAVGESPRGGTRVAVDFAGIGGGR